MNLSIRNTVILSIFSIFLGNSKAFTQLTLDEAINIGFGTSYLKLKQHLSSKFSYNRTLMKGDFLNTYLIKYEEVPFDYYGNANYHFRIVENKLVNVEIEFEFNPSEIWKVKRVSELLEHDLIKRFNLLNEDSLNADEAVKELTKNCRYNFKKEEFDSLMPINYGTNYYDVYRKNPTDT